MPYSKKHKQGTRERILESARRLFNGTGFSGVTIERIRDSRGSWLGDDQLIRK
jgi:AcrR family transcriptional regulator